MTSPPYWGLRDYGTPPQIWGGDPACRHRWGADVGVLTSHPQQSRNGRGVVGDRGRHPSAARSSFKASQGAFCARCGAWRGALGLEPDYRLYVDHLVAVIREVHRVLRRDGTLWLNLGDCYATGAGKAYRGTHGADPKAPSAGLAATQPNRMPQPGLKPKDLVGIPWRVAFALQDDGWWLRRDHVWAKPNPMPESVRDRCTTAHEYLFLLTKSARYYYDGDAIKESANPDNARTARNAYPGGKHGAGVRRDDEVGATALRCATGARNKRSVWTIATAPFRGAHFATFPPALVEPCILAGTSERGVCPKCRAPWERMVSTERVKHKQPPGQAGAGRQFCEDGGAVSEKSMFRTGLVPVTETIGWQPTCSCDAARPVPATVLDPFLGAGTTALVADRLGRHAIGVELSPAYAAMARARIGGAKLARAAA